MTAAAAGPRNMGIVWEQNEAQKAGLPRGYTGLVFRKCPDSRKTAMVYINSATKEELVELGKTHHVQMVGGKDWDGWYLSALIATHEVNQNTQVAIYVMGSLKGFLKGQC